jgi:hypothetical protein
MKNQITPIFEIDGRLLIVFDHTLAKKVNHILRRYPIRTKFEPGSQPIFYLGCKDSEPAIRALLGPLIGLNDASGTLTAAS